MMLILLSIIYHLLHDTSEFLTWTRILITCYLLRSLS